MTATATAPATRTAEERAHGRSVLRGRLFMALLFVAAIIWIIPMVWMFSLSLTPNEILQLDTTNLLPQSPTLENFSDVISVGLTPRWFLNSMIVTGVTWLSNAPMSTVGPPI